MKRRELNPEERAEAERLAAAWLAFKGANKGVTQEWLGAETGLGTQGAVGQYLRGVIPLNVEALMAFARVLQIDPRAISNRLANIVGGLLEKNDGGGVADSLKLSVETAAELRLLSVYRLANEDERAAIDIVVEQIRRRLSAMERHQG